MTSSIQICQNNAIPNRSSFLGGGVITSWLASLLSGGDGGILSSPEALMNPDKPGDRLEPK
jgi:hypothetical protein